MKSERAVSFGWKAHSGWAALVVLGRRDGDLEVKDRRRIELVDDSTAWAKQVYHAAEELPREEARTMVERGIDSARRAAVREMRAAIKRARDDGLAVRACAVLTGGPMPDWTVDQILAVHFRMHKAEGVLFRDVLSRAAVACDLRLVEIPEKSLAARAAAALAAPVDKLDATVAKLGKSVGAPWGKDQKEAALAAMVALETRRS